MVKLHFRVPTTDDVTWMVDNITPADKAEVLASGNVSVAEAIATAMSKSKACVVAILDDKPLVIYGLHRPSVLGSLGVPWMLTTTQSKHHGREYMVYTRMVIREMLEECDILTNYVHAANLISIKWLKALGFTIDNPVPNGITGELFHRFHLRKKVNDV